MRRGLYVTAVGLSLLVSQAGATTLPSGFTETLVSSGLTAPTAMEIAPDGRVFVLEQPGRVRVIKNGVLLGTPFLTLTVNAALERGLLGIAFDPAFASNSFVYVYYTATSPTIHNRVSRFTASGDVAVAGSERVLMDLPTVSAQNHNGGAVHFGRDGKLYVGVGENAVPSNATSLNTTFGKILRLNADGTIPTDNPFYTQTTGNNRAIWARGLRNPFTFAVQPGTGRIFLNDVGNISWEEINDGVAGRDYGWGSSMADGDATAFYRYGSSQTVISGTPATCAITGGTFYNPAAASFPSQYVGRYFFGDYCGHWIRTIDPATKAVATFATGIGSFGGVVDLKVAADGSLYYLARTDGSVFRVRYTAVSPTPTPTPTATPSSRPRVTPTPTPTSTPSSRVTPTPTATPSSRPRVTPTPTPTATPSSRVTPTPTPRPTVTPTPSGAPAWQAWTPYVVGNLVSYDGVVYRCLQSHTSQPDWQPPNVPALWARQ